MPSTIPANVDWVRDVCVFHVASTAQQGNKLYTLGGYTYLRSSQNLSEDDTQLANSHLYALDFSGYINLVNNYAQAFTSVTRLPDSVPRSMWSNFFWRDSTLNLFGGAQTDRPIFLANGSYDLRDRVNLGDDLWTYNVNNSKWTRSRPYGATEGKPIQMAAKAFDEKGDKGRGVLWFYGGEYAEQPVAIGSEVKGPKADAVEYSDLWRMPGDCGQSNSTAPLTACKQNTSGVSAESRPRTRSSMVWIDNTGNGTSAEGLLVLLGGARDNIWVSMRSVHVYDVATATWYMQPTTAENDHFPPDRNEACAVVGKAVDGSSYNIYVHGGVRQDKDLHIIGGIWILTLPTFHWIYSDISGENPRSAPTCSIIHEKFMVRFGGLPNMGHVKCDDFAGIQILDLETLQWVTRIDVVPNRTYRVPDLVSKTIGGGATGGANYTSPQKGFIDRKLYDVFNVTTANPLPQKTRSPPTKLPTGTIIGAILGGLISLIIILGLILWVLKQRRRKDAERVAAEQVAAQQVAAQQIAAEQEKVAATHEPGFTGVISEMEAREVLTPELPSYRYEVQGIVMGSQHNEDDKWMPIQ